MKEIVVSFRASQEEAATALKALSPENESPSRALASRLLSDFARGVFLDACGKLEAVPEVVEPKKKTKKNEKA